LLLYVQGEYHRPALTYDFDEQSNKSGPIWHCRVPRTRCPDAHYYAYRIDGPAPAPGYEWHTFDWEKILVDPYAGSVFFPPGFQRDAARRKGANDGQAPLGLLNICCCPDPSWRGKRVRHGSDLILYEMHVKGFTRDPSSGIPAPKRGTFGGIVEKIPYLKELGITAVELMPVFQFDPGNGNYWGYMPLNFFSPHQSYTERRENCQQRTIFREMVQALHAAEIEVILDVVYNHTCEGDQNGPTYSFKGIDNSTYYMISGSPEAPYANFSGTGNTLHTANRAVRQLILDSLRYWVAEMGVDGFRFDLASIFSRGSDGTINLDDPPIFAQIADDPVLAGTRLIAEPWDPGGAYQLGRAFPGTHWHQWNGLYRDTLQRFVRGDRGLVPDLMTRLYGSSDLFPDDRVHALRPFQSVNYITSHDGFTLYDLVSYNRKRNHANGQNNQDGHTAFSWNCGWEGDDQLPEEIVRLRKRQVRNFFCLLMLSNGTPMFRMGDEFLQTQGGNNNPFNQDNETSWLNWNRLHEHADVFRFVRDMIAFRKAHPSIARSRFWRDDVRWHGPDGPVDLSPESRTLAYFLRRLHPGDEDLYIMINTSDQEVAFRIGETDEPGWRLRIDTSRTAGFPETPLPVGNAACPVEPRSVVVLARG
jgi:isoamylase